MIELCDTPVECDLEINEAASGVAICNTGLLITGLEGTLGKVEDLDMPKPFLVVAELEEVGDGKVLVLDSKGIVADVDDDDVIEYAVVVTGDNALVVVAVLLLFVGLGVLTLLLFLPPSGASVASSVVFEAF